NATTLSLEPLAPAAMEELLEGFVPGLPDELRTRILERAEGVPLYAVETVRMLLDRGLLERDDEAYRPTGPIEALEVPETLPERGQYAFLQDLLKQIGYETLAKADRKAKHLAAAEYLGRATGQAEQEAVEVVAAHYVDAYEAAPDASDAEAIRRKAAERLALA